MTNNTYNLKKILILLGLVLGLLLLYYTYVKWGVTPDLIGDSNTSNLVGDSTKFVCKPDEIDWTVYTPKLTEREITILDFLSKDPEICQLLEKIMSKK